MAKKTQISVLEEAAQIVDGDREQTYGSPSRNLETIAQFWTVYLRRKYGSPVDLTVDDVCQLMILVKQSRLINDPTHRDSLVDVCGYARLQERCQDE